MLQYGSWDRINTNHNQTPALSAVGQDGWIPERMATFLEVLADTGIVSEAARASRLRVTRDWPPTVRRARR